MELAKRDQFNDKDFTGSINMNTGAQSSIMATDRQTTEGFFMSQQNSIETLATLDKKQKQLTRRVTEPILSGERGTEKNTEI